MEERQGQRSEVTRKISKLRLEIAHVLFIDIVGYSKLLIDEQSEALQELNQIVRNTEAARAAEAAGQLIILPTGDGMALVFTGSVEDPVECALQISQALHAQPSLPVRMGIHSGPVHHVADVNQRENIAGAGINIAQRVMDCGDAGRRSCTISPLAALSARAGRLRSETRCRRFRRESFCRYRRQSGTTRKIQTRQIGAAARVDIRATETLADPNITPGH